MQSKAVYHLAVFQNMINVLGRCKLQKRHQNFLQVCDSYAQVLKVDRSSGTVGAALELGPGASGCLGDQFLARSMFSQFFHRV